MSRAASTSDVFNAIAEPRRREILDLLSRSGRRGVNDLAETLGLAQPAVSKHLGVLRRVGLVQVEREGKFRFYRLDPRPLRPIHDWVKMYQRFWTEQLDRIRQRAEAQGSRGQ